MLNDANIALHILFDKIYVIYSQIQSVNTLNTNHFKNVTIAPLIYNLILFVFLDFFLCVFSVNILK